MEAKEAKTDFKLVSAFRGGDDRAFAELVRRYERPLFTFILRMVGDRSAAEDIYQETFLRMLRALPRYRDTGKFSGWLFSIAHRLCIDSSRRVKRREAIFPTSIFNGNGDHEFPYPDPHPLQDKLLEDKELSNLITKAFEYMTAAQREVFLLRQHAGLTFREIAEQLERPLNTVLGQMRGAIINLNKYLEKYYV